MVLLTVEIISEVHCILCGGLGIISEVHCIFCGCLGAGWCR